MVDFREARDDADYDCFGCRNEPWPPLTAYEREAALEAWSELPSEIRESADEWIEATAPSFEEYLLGLGRGFER